MIQETVSIVLFAAVVLLTAYENAKAEPKEEPEIEHSVTVPAVKRTYIRGYYRETAA